MTRFTLYGLLKYDPTLFDDVELPDGLDKELVISNIISKSGDLYCYYQQPTLFKINTTRWFKMHYHNFKCMIEALLAEYNPIENYDRYEDEWQTTDSTKQNIASGSDSLASSGTDSLSRSGSDSLSSSGSDSVSRDGLNTSTKEVSAFDSSDYEAHDKTTDDIDEDSTTTYGKTDTQTYGSTDTNTYGKTDTNTYGRHDDYTGNDTTHRGIHAHGNIGMTSNQKMVLDELQLRVYNIYDVIATMFEADNLIQIY